MKKWLSKTNTDVTIGDSLAFAVVYCALYLGVVVIAMNSDEISEKAAAAKEKAKELIHKAKAKVQKIKK